MEIDLKEMRPNTYTFHAYIDIETPYQLYMYGGYKILPFPYPWETNQSIYFTVPAELRLTEHS